MQHANVEIPQEKSAVITDAPKSICPLIAPPRIKGYRRYPGVVSLASSDNLALREGPDCDQIVLATGHYVFAVRRPAN